MKSFLNFLMSLIGTGVLFTLGLVIGFWIEVLFKPELPNGFYECKDCGPSFVETYRFGKKGL